MCTGLHEPAGQSQHRIWSPRGLPPQHTCSAELVGLAIVAAIQAELDTATSLRITNQRQAPHPPPQSATSAVQYKGSRYNEGLKGSRDESKAPSHKSIFTVASPPKDDASYFNTSSPLFFNSCFLCRRPFSPNKDIYMYRGNQAFCTKECRHHQMVVDEHREKLQPCVTTFSSSNCHIDSL